MNGSRLLDTATPFEIPVCCEGREHIIEWRSGHLRLLDHADRLADLLDATPSDRAAGCLRLVDDLRNGRVNRLPPQLRDVVNAARADRAIAAPNPAAPRAGRLPTERSFEVATVRRAMPALRASLDVWAERLQEAPARNEVRGVSVVPSPSPDPNDVTGVGARGVISPSDAHVTVHLRPDWIREVWGRGLCVIDDCFVLDYLPPRRSDERPGVLALRWETDAALPGQLVAAASPAEVIAGGDRPHLRWQTPPSRLA